MQRKYQVIASRVDKEATVGYQIFNPTEAETHPKKEDPKQTEVCQTFTNRENRYRKAYRGCTFSRLGASKTDITHLQEPSRKLTKIYQSFTAKRQNTNREYT